MVDLEKLAIIGKNNSVLLGCIDRVCSFNCCDGYVPSELRNDVPRTEFIV